MHVRCGPGEKLEITSKVYLSVSHAAAYAVVSYQTAYLKYYYPVEFMAALMNSVIDNQHKVCEYILVCRKMDIQILPPDINHGEYDFTADHGKIRYGLLGLRSIGKQVIDQIVEERERGGAYVSLKDFIERNTTGCGKRATENFIKAGAFDGLDGNRRQKLMVFEQFYDSATKNRRNMIQGQMSLFDFADEETKADFEVRMPNVPDFDPETRLAMEKEVLGFYLSGHPLEKYMNLMERVATAASSDFQLDEETGVTVVRPGQSVTVGGMVVEKNVKYTKKNQMMCFLSLEDLVGRIEVVVFPNVFEKYNSLLSEEAKVFIKGRVDGGEDRAGKILLEKVIPFSQIPKEIWVQFADRKSYSEAETDLAEILKKHPGENSMVIYLKNVKAMKRMPAAFCTDGSEELMTELEGRFGSTNVRMVEKIPRSL